MRIDPYMLFSVRRRQLLSSVTHTTNFVDEKRLGATLRTIISYGILFLFLISGSASALDPKCELVDKVKPDVEAIRELKFKNSPKCEVLNREDFYRFKKSQYDADDGGPGRLENEEAAYKLLGLIPESYRYAYCLSKEAGDNALASYDPRTKSIVIPAETESRADILAHELTHALQDQYFNLEKLQRRANRGTDSALALGALAEGDALRVQREYIDRKKQKIPEEKITDSAECALPPALNLQTEFPYTFGALYVDFIVARDGAASLDELFKDPPKTTHEIIHRERPAGVVRTTEKKFRPLLSESLGEYTTGLLLRSAVTKEDGYKIAKHLRDDEFSYLAGKKIRWRTDWDSVLAASNFKRALASVLSKRFGVRIAEAPNFVLAAGKDAVSVESVGNEVVLEISSTG